MKIAWHGKHFGEEPPLVGSCEQGSGTIFFSHCNLHCVFCQNYQISQSGLGRKQSVTDLVSMMLKLEASGAANINLVTPMLWWHSIKQAIMQARSEGLSIPIVWNSNGYETLPILKEVKNLVDIYLPDFKYSDDTLGLQYSGVKNYVATTQRAINEMQQQVGHLKIKNGVARKGLIVRHLILPGHVQNSLGVLDILAKMNPRMTISLMTQYQPLHRAEHCLNINRRLSENEFDQVYDHLLRLNLENGWVQDFSEDFSDGVTNSLVPNFKNCHPFQAK